jgi:hypothetical protein
MSRSQSERNFAHLRVAHNVEGAAAVKPKPAEKENEGAEGLKDVTVLMETHGNE